MKENVSLKGEGLHVELGGGQLIEEFADVRAGPLRVLGAMTVVLGCAPLACGLASDLLMGVFGFLVMTLGVAVFALGTRRNRNRVLVYTTGIIHNKRGRLQSHLWRDIQAIVLDQQERHEAIGVIPFVTFRTRFCLHKENGDWIQMSIPPLSSLAMETILKTWAAARGLATTALRSDQIIS